ATQRSTKASACQALPPTSTVPRTAAPLVGSRIAAPRAWNPGSHNSCVPDLPGIASSTDRSSGRGCSISSPTPAHWTIPSTGGALISIVAVPEDGIDTGVDPDVTDIE